MLPHADLTQRLKDDRRRTPSSSCRCARPRCGCWAAAAARTRSRSLLEHLEGDNEALQGGAADALAELAGQNFGVDARALARVVGPAQGPEQRAVAGTAPGLPDQPGAAAGGRPGAGPDAGAALAAAGVQPAARRGPAGLHPDGAGAGRPDGARLAGHWALELLPAADAAAAKDAGAGAVPAEPRRHGGGAAGGGTRPGPRPDPAVFERLKALVEQGRPPVRAAAARALARQAREDGPDAQPGTTR